jgi:predicted PurR-regulated permease PerM
MHIKGITRNTLLITGGLFLIFLIWYFSAIVTYILISVVLAFIGRPLVKWLSLLHVKKIYLPKGVAALITLIIMWFVLFALFRFIIPLLIKELETLSQIDIKALINYIEEPLTKLLRLSGDESLLLENKTFMDVLTERVSSKFDLSGLSNVFVYVAGTVGDFLIAVFSISFITFFFLKEKSMFKEGILLIVPTEFEEKVANILDSISYLLRRYFLGIILEVFMVGLLVTLGLTIAGIEFNHAVIIGFFCGLFNVIPYLGPWMGAVTGLLIGAAININANFMDHTLPLLGLMSIVFLSVQIIDNVLFQPLIYSSSVKAHPLEIFLVIMAAGSLAGILGMFLAIPAYTIIRVIAKEFFDNMKLVRKLTESLNKEGDKSKNQ